MIKSLNVTPPQEWLEDLRMDPPSEWLEELNVDPTTRVAAGLGTKIVQQLQEELIGSAWDQAGLLREANKHLRVSQLARTISLNIFERSFKQMDPDVLVRLVNSLPQTGNSEGR